MQSCFCANFCKLPELFPELFPEEKIVAEVIKHSHSHKTDINRNVDIKIIKNIKS